MNIPTISIIAAIAKDRGIGYKNKLLVHLPDDLKHFKAITSGHIVIMGQTTFESLGSKPLPKRINVILSLDKNFVAPVDCPVFHSIEEALNWSKKSGDSEIFFIGGASIYRQAIKYADKLYLTMIDAVYPADTFFPEYGEFNQVLKEEKQEYNGIRFKFVELVKDGDKN
ncbi:MAG: diacylglycerol kinase [Parcubacteria group bacterium]|nr:MAG: diacylglycerol kinase [Parcubacteria group bacterium]